MRLGNGIQKKGERGEGLQLIYLLSWPEWPGGLQGMPAFIGGWEKKMNRGRKVEGEDLYDWGDPLELRVEGTGDSLLESWACDWQIGFGGEEGKVKMYT